MEQIPYLGIIHLRLLTKLIDFYPEQVVEPIYSSYDTYAAPQNLK